jgi:hypothetical protein
MYSVVYKTRTNLRSNVGGNDSRGTTRIRGSDVFFTHQGLRTKIPPHLSAESGDPPPPPSLVGVDSVSDSARYASLRCRAKVELGLARLKARASSLARDS